MVVSKWFLSGAQPEISNEGAVWGVWRRNSQPTKANGGLGTEAPSRRRLMGVWGQKPPAAGGTGTEPPVLENFAFFSKNNLILRLF